MYIGRSVFAQVMDFVPLRRFHTCVKRYGGNRKVKRFTCLDQFRVMVFAQLTYRQSLRDIEACLRAMQPKLYHLGIRSKVARNTLDNANGLQRCQGYKGIRNLIRAQRPGRSTGIHTQRPSHDTPDYRFLPPLRQ